MKNLRGVAEAALGSPGRLVVALGSNLQPFTIGWPKWVAPAMKVATE